MTTKGGEMKDSLNIVYKELMGLAGDNDPNVSLHLEYHTKVSLSLINKCR
jgi:hypothetical protein